MPQPPGLSQLTADFTAQLESLVERIVADRLVRSFGDLRASLLSPQPKPTNRTRRPRRVIVRAEPEARSAPPSKPLASLPTPKVATVIPPEITITRLPPGPVPKQRTYSTLRSQCRLPGCTAKNSGPRYDYFCRDHYAAFNREEREKYKALWKHQREPSVNNSSAPPARATAGR